jgi:hypothetical protein
MRSNLKDRSSLSIIRSMEKASDRVNSWPEWKRESFSFRRQDLARPNSESKALQATPHNESGKDLSLAEN